MLQAAVAGLLVLSWLVTSPPIQLASAATKDPVIAAAGDISCDPTDPNFNGGTGTATACREKDVSNFLVNGHFAAVLSLGDNQYDCGSLAAYQDVYDPTWGRVKSITHPVPGNHEYLTSGGTGCDSSNLNGAGYFNYFGAAAGNPGQGYYSFDIGSWHLIALNSNCTDAGGCSANSPQGAWLAADLAAHPQQCILAYWHIPLFSSGGRANNGTMQLWQILYAAHADVVLNGHDHIYERFDPQAPNGLLDEANGIRQFTVGTGGADHTGIASIAANSVVTNTDTFGVLALTLHPTGYSWVFDPVVGSFTDSGSASCHNPGTTPTPTPTGLPGAPRSVTAFSQIGADQVAWLAPTNTGGSPITNYTATASPGGRTCASAGSLSCVVTGLTPGTAYKFTVTATNGQGPGPPSGASAGVKPVTGATFVALTPTRVLDTRVGIGLAGAFESHVARTFQVAGGDSGIPVDAVAVTGNVTVTQQTSDGYIYVGPVATDAPTSSNLNFPVGDDRANAVTVELGAGGTLSATYAAPTPGQTAQIVFDATGYFEPNGSGATYVALNPNRLLDTRVGTGLTGPFSSRVARTFQVTGGSSGVPANAIAVTGNLTVTQQTSGGFLYAGPVAMDDPASSTLNFPTNDDRANAVTVALGAGGELSVTYAAPTVGPTAQVIFDVTGYFVPGTAGNAYVPLSPTRLLDTRLGTGLAGPFSSHVARTFQVDGSGGVPAGAAALTGNLTVTDQTSMGFLFAGPDATDNPTSSTLNFPFGDDRANAVSVALAASGSLSIAYAAPTLGQTADVILDATGYFLPAL